MLPMLDDVMDKLQRYFEARFSSPNEPEEPLAEVENAFKEVDQAITRWREKYPNYQSDPAFKITLTFNIPQSKRRKCLRENHIMFLAEKLFPSKEFFGGHNDFHVGDGGNFIEYYLPLDWPDTWKESLVMLAGSGWGPGVEERHFAPWNQSTEAPETMEDYCFNIVRETRARLLHNHGNVKDEEVGAQAEKPGV